MVNKFEVGKTYRWIGASSFRNEGWISDLNAWCDGKPRKCLSISTTYSGLLGCATFENITGGNWSYYTRWGCFFEEVVEEKTEIPRKGPCNGGPILIGRHYAYIGPQGPTWGDLPRHTFEGMLEWFDGKPHECLDIVSAIHQESFQPRTHYKFKGIAGGRPLEYGSTVKGYLSEVDKDMAFNPSCFKVNLSGDLERKPEIFKPFVEGKCYRYIGSPLPGNEGDMLLKAGFGAHMRDWLDGKPRICKGVRSKKDSIIPWNTPLSETDQECIFSDIYAGGWRYSEDARRLFVEVADSWAMEHGTPETKHILTKFHKTETTNTTTTAGALCTKRYNHDTGGIDQVSDQKPVSNKPRIELDVEPESIHISRASIAKDVIDNICVED